MKRTKGSLLADLYCDAQTLKIRRTEPHVQHVIDEFMRLLCMTPLRLMQMPKGILILARRADCSGIGAIFVYDREARKFYRLTFSRMEGTLGVHELEALSAAYELIRYAAKPALLKDRVRAFTRHSASIAAKLVKEAKLAKGERIQAAVSAA